MKKILLLFFLWSSVSAQEGSEWGKELLGSYSFKNSKSLEYTDWKERSQELFFTVGDFEEDKYKNIKFIISSDYTIFYENVYYIDLYIKNKLISRHYISLITKRDTGEVYDFLCGQNVFCLNLDNKYLLMYYEFNFSTEQFKRVFLFYGN